MAIDVETISFANPRPVSEYLRDISGEVEAIVGDAKSGIMWAVGEPLGISGDSGAGKTFALLQLIKARHQGGMWLGRFPTKISTAKKLFLNLDRDGMKARMKAMNFPMMGKDLVCMDFTELKGLNFMNDPNLLIRLSQHTGATELYIDGISQLINDPTDTQQGQAFAIAIKSATQMGINIAGTMQNKRPRSKDAQTFTGRGAWLGSIHLLGTFGIGVTLQLKDGVVTFKQIKNPDGGELIEGDLSHNHEQHFSLFTGGTVLGALMVRGRATRDELASDTGWSDGTVKKRLDEKAHLWKLIPATDRYPNGGRKPDQYEYVGLNSDSTQDVESTQLKPLNILSSVNHKHLAVKGVT